MRESGEEAAATYTNIPPKPHRNNGAAYLMASWTACALVSQLRSCPVDHQCCVQHISTLITSTSTFFFFLQKRRTYVSSSGMNATVVCTNAAYVTIMTTMYGAAVRKEICGNSVGCAMLRDLYRHNAAGSNQDCGSACSMYLFRSRSFTLLCERRSEIHV